LFEPRSVTNCPESPPILLTAVPARKMRPEQRPPQIPDRGGSPSQRHDEHNGQAVSYSSRRCTRIRIESTDYTDSADSRIRTYHNDTTNTTGRPRQGGNKLNPFLAAFVVHHSPFIASRFGTSMYQIWFISSRVASNLKIGRFRPNACIVSLLPIEPLPKAVLPQVLPWVLPPILPRALPHILRRTQRGTLPHMLRRTLLHVLPHALPGTQRGTLQGTQWGALPQALRGAL